MKYLELISQDAKAQEKEDLQFKAEEAKHSVDIALLETRKSIAAHSKRLKEAQKAVPYDLQTEIDLTIKIQNLERGLEIATKIKGERF